MKRSTIIVLIIVAAFVILLATGLVLWKVLAPKSEVPTPVTQNPFGTSGQVGAVSVKNSLSLTLSDGTAVSVPDFTQTGQPAWASSATGFQVAGSATDVYLVTYIPSSDPKIQSQFLITLYEEPFGAVRKSAEAALRNRLQLTDSELCKLDTLVSTAPGMSDIYDTRNLGLSFCPGSVTLP